MASIVRYEPRRKGAFFSLIELKDVHADGREVVRLMHYNFLEGSAWVRVFRPEESEKAWNTEPFGSRYKFERKDYCKIKGGLCWLHHVPLMASPRFTNLGDCWRRMRFQVDSPLCFV